ncbi:MAG: hypothetical protein WDN49_26890 [Acetobacteraceae bacterium]
MRTVAARGFVPPRVPVVEAPRHAVAARPRPEPAPAKLARPGAPGRRSTSASNQSPQHTRG